jgi:hypothetical protein
MYSVDIMSNATKGNQMTKPTVATLKSFIRKNRESLHVKVKASFDGMEDGIRGNADACYAPAREADTKFDNNLGIAGVWLVGRSNDWVTPISEDGFTGYRVSNCCGTFVVAVRA